MWYSYVEIDFGVQKTAQFIINGMAVQSTEIQDTELLTQRFSIPAQLAF